MAQKEIHSQKKWLRGDNYVNIQCRIMVLVHCPCPDCHLSINQVQFSIPFVLSKIWPRQTSIMEKMVKGRYHCKYTGYDYGSCALPSLS